MSVKIRLKRGGTTNRPFFRVVVIDSRMQRDGRFIEELGYYDPIMKPQVFSVDRDKVDMWLARGAQPSDTVRTLLKKPNSVFSARELDRDFTPGPPRPKPVRSEVEASAPGDRRGGRGDRDRGGRGGRGGDRGGRRGRPAEAPAAPEAPAE